MQKHNLAFVLNLQKPKKDGSFPLRIRATIKRERSYTATGIALKLDQWDKDGQKVINHIQKNSFNIILAQQIAKVEKELIDQELNGAEKLNLKKQKSKDFFEYAYAQIKRDSEKDTIATTRTKKEAINKFKRFKNKISFSNITPDLIYEFETYCRKLGNCENTVWKSIKFVRTYINKAVFDDTITVDPLKKYKRLTYINPKIEFLSAKDIELIKIISTNETIKTIIKDAANWFLFSCNCGLRYGDVKGFTSKYILEDKIILRTDKTGSDITIKIHPELCEIISRLGQNVKTNQQYNRNLKFVQLLAGVQTNLKSHVARHTFAVQFLNRGGSMEALSKLLGHTNMKTTQIYGKISNIRLDDEIDKVFGK